MPGSPRKNHHRAAATVDATSPPPSSALHVAACALSAAFHAVVFARSPTMEKLYQRRGSFVHHGLPTTANPQDPYSFYEELPSHTTHGGVSRGAAAPTALSWAAATRRLVLVVPRFLSRASWAIGLMLARFLRRFPLWSGPAVAALFLLINWLFLSDSAVVDVAEPTMLAAAERSAYYEAHPELLADSLLRVAQQTSLPRGIILPLFDGIASLGISLILELRAFGITLPIEVPHCGDLNSDIQEQIRLHDPLVHVYDVCMLAAEAADTHNPMEKLFCTSLEQCHQIFRSFDIKILAVVLSRFEEVMLLDADTLFFQNPMELWDVPQYTSTGTLFFHDRVCSETTFLARRVDGRNKVSVMHQFLEKFDVTPFRHLPTMERAKSSLSRLSPVPLSFDPSEFLLSSHTWNVRSGHQMDSSVVLWNKARQPRATAILASFIALDGHPKLTRSGRFAIAYGDKECFFLACEMAETQYGFSDFAVGAIGWDVDHRAPFDDPDDLKDPNAILCGDALHFFPQKPDDGSDPQALYINSDNILVWNPTTRTVYRTKAKDAAIYPGSLREQDLPLVCAFDVTPMHLTPEETKLWMQRRRLHNVALSWLGGQQQTTWLSYFW